MGKISIYDNKLIFERRDELTIIEPYGQNCIRTRSTRNAKILDENWTLLPAQNNANFTIEGDEKVAVLTNGLVRDRKSVV